MGTKLVRLLAIVAVLVSCSDDGPLSIRELRDVEKARARWLNSSVRRAYTFEVRQDCYCPVEFVRWNTVTVVNDSVTDVRVTAGDLAVPRSMWSSVVTVERMFATLSVVDQTYLEDVRVRFDAQYGYPVAIELLAGPQIADADRAVYARNLRPASGIP